MLLGSNESYANPENFVVTTMRTNNEGISTLVLKGCVDIVPDGIKGVQTLGNGFEVGKDDQVWLTGRDDALETDRFSEAGPIKASALIDGDAYAAFDVAPMSFIAGEQSVECGHEVPLPEKVEDHESGREVTLTEGAGILVGSVVNVHINDEGQLDPATFTVLAGGERYSIPE